MGVNGRSCQQLAEESRRQVKVVVARRGEAAYEPSSRDFHNRVNTGNNAHVIHAQQMDKTYEEKWHPSEKMLYLSRTT